MTDALHEVRGWVASIGSMNLDTGRRITKADALLVIDRLAANPAPAGLHRLVNAAHSIYLTLATGGDVSADQYDELNGALYPFVLAPAAEEEGT